MHLLAVLAHSAISPVDAEPTYDFVLKNEIIRHMRSPTFATMLAGKQELISDQELSHAANHLTRRMAGRVRGAKPTRRDA